MNTTLEQIKSHHPCESSYKKLLKGLNKTKADSEPLEFRSIYNILDADDVIWATKVLDKKYRVYAGALFADTVKHLNKDKRVHNCIEVCFRYAREEATEEELKEAAAAANCAASAAAADAAYVAADAAYAARAATRAYASDYAAAAAYVAAARAATRAYASDSAADAADAYAARAAYDAYDTAIDATKNKLALIFLTYIEGI